MRLIVKCLSDGAKLRTEEFDAGTELDGSLLCPGEMLERVTGCVDSSDRRSISVEGEVCKVSRGD